MAKVFNFYMDDSGTRHPTNKPGKRPQHGYDWFALGGIVIAEEDEAAARELHADFLKKWDVKAPLHSSEIRSQNKGFAWLRNLQPDDRDRFYEDLYRLMQQAPVHAIACVVDRPGYNARYQERFNENPWMLCKTAFSIVVERACKYARENGRRLRIAPERCNGPEDKLIATYYADLKSSGMPFDPSNSSKYGPVSPDEFASILYELRPKMKSSPMAQFADLFLWPICMGGYNPDCRPYARLKADGKLIESVIPEEAWSIAGTKYSCFELVQQSA